MSLIELLKQSKSLNASDVHLTIGSPPVMRIDGKIQKVGDTVLSSNDIKKLVNEALTGENMNELMEKGEIDTSLSVTNLSRFRVNAYRQRGSYSMVLRTIPHTIPTIEGLGLPEVLHSLSVKKRGLILVTGPTGSGKSTTLASMINKINNERNCHILTLEDPIEYLHKHNKSIVNQREIGLDTKSFSNALRAALRQDPDVILVGEMRDIDTTSIAVTAAETGHLVLSTMHTVGAAKTIDRIIDAFPPHQQQQIRIQLSTVLEAVISQQLLPKADGSGRVAAHEIMIVTSAIKNMIREGKNHQIQTSIQTGSKYGMVTMDNSLLNLYQSGKITKETLLDYSMDANYINMMI